jgi:hypothetical protein
MVIAVSTGCAGKMRNPGKSLLLCSFPPGSRLLGASVQIRFIATFKAPFKFYLDSTDRSAGGLGFVPREVRDLTDARGKGRPKMARFELGSIDEAGLGRAPDAAETFFELGMMYSIGRSVPIDYVSAHKWFNLAAMRGSAEAARLRREIAEQMSAAEIAAAQRAARTWLQAQ